MRWKLVPTDVTPEILNADNEIGDGWIIKDRGEWVSLLAAAPPASQDEELVEKVADAIWKCKYGPGNRIAAECIARAVLKMLEGNQ